MDHEHHHHEHTAQQAPGHGEHSHGDGAGSMMLHHAMSFHGGYQETLLFNWWRVDSLASLIGSMLGVALLAALYEGLKYYREYLFWRCMGGCDEGVADVPLSPIYPDEPSDRSRRVRLPRRPQGILDGMHLWQTALHVLQVLLSYTIMLLFMYFNVWICAAIVVGAAVGFFLFAWKKAALIETTSASCH